MKCFTRVVLTQFVFLLVLAIPTVGCWLAGYDFPTQRGKYAAEYFFFGTIFVTVSSGAAVLTWNCIDCSKPAGA